MSEITHEMTPANFFLELFQEEYLNADLEVDTRKTSFDDAQPLLDKSAELEAIVRRCSKATEMVFSEMEAKGWIGVEEGPAANMEVPISEVAQEVIENTTLQALQSVMGQVVAELVTAQHETVKRTQRQADEIARVIIDLVRAEALPEARSRRTTTAEDVKTGNGGVDLVLIKDGHFQMGSPTTEADSDDSERPQHEVAMPSFYLGKYPVTNAQYAQFMQANPKVVEPDYWSDRRFNGERQPVVGVSWEAANAFAQWAGGRLPTEAEWEYAARAGTTTRYWWGDEFESERVNAGCAIGRTSPVDAYAPNPWGLHDVVGNVWEWVEDCWNGSYTGAPTDGSALKSGDCSRRVLRGGSWLTNPNRVRSATRNGGWRDYRYDYVGFRVAQDL